MAAAIKAALKRIKSFAEGREREDFISPYYDTGMVASGVKKGRHRELIGGLWEEVGQWQHDLMLAEGLKPAHLLLDVGCGSFRGGVRFVDYLDPGNYYGIDINRSLIEAGYAREIAVNGLAEKLPRKNLLVTEDFSCAVFNTEFDFAIAVSVFTHTPWNHLRVALERLAPTIKPGGVFLASYFPCPDRMPFASPITHTLAGVITHPTKDPYHYKFSDMEHAARDLPWRVEAHPIDDHPRGQRIVRFTRSKT